MSVWTRRLALSSLFVIAAAIAGPASAQTKLKWAHVYEVAEPYHTEALWAADEIKKRTNGKYEIQVFPASQLGTNAVGAVAAHAGEIGDMARAGGARRAFEYLGRRDRRIHASPDFASSLPSASHALTTTSNK